MPLPRIDKRTPIPKTTDGQRPVFAGDINKIIEFANEIETEIGQVGITTTTNITADAGGVQSGATQLNYGYNKVTTVATEGDSVKLPIALVNKWCYVINADNATLDIYPSVGENMEGANANDKVTLVGGTSLEFVCFVDGEWTAIG